MPVCVGRLLIMPALCGDPDKVWLVHEAGEAGDFCRLEFEAALGSGIVAGQVDEMLDHFFWVNF